MNINYSFKFSNVPTLSFSQGSLKPVEFDWAAFNIEKTKKIAKNRLQNFYMIENIIDMFVETTIKNCWLPIGFTDDLFFIENRFAFYFRKKDH